MTKESPFNPLNQRSLTKHIYCAKSGVILGELKVFLNEGHMPYMQSHSEAVYTHPFYNLSSVVLIKKAREAEQQIAEFNTFPEYKHQLRLQILTSALLHSLGVLKADIPSLPPFGIAIGSADRIIKLCDWYHHQTTKRIKFPQFHISRNNSNEAWNNLKDWLDCCFEIKKDWQTEVRKMKHNALLRDLGDELVDLDANLYRKIDLSKVWNWIKIQLSENGTISLGTLQRYENLFLRGDVDPEFWVRDDIDDLVVDVTKFCDENHEIMFAVRKRLHGLRAIIADFYGSFTLVQSGPRRVVGEGQTDQEKQIYAELDQKAETLGELPPKPEPKDFATRGLFMQAEAKWRLLSQAFERRSAHQSNSQTVEGEL